MLVGGAGVVDRARAPSSARDPERPARRRALFCRACTAVFIVTGSKTTYYISAVCTHRHTHRNAPSQLIGFYIYHQHHASPGTQPPQPPLPQRAAAPQTHQLCGGCAAAAVRRRVRPAGVCRRVAAVRRPVAATCSTCSTSCAAHARSTQHTQHTQHRADAAGLQPKAA